MEAPSIAPPLDCLLIADDLTGACDAAVHFAVLGRRTSVCCSPSAEAVAANVLAVSTNSRDREPAEAVAIMEDVASRMPHASAAILFKKIDSTLRGNVGVEIAAAMRVFGCDAAVVCPAYPAQHRTVEAGSLRVVGSKDFEPVDVPARLQVQGLERCAQVRRGRIREALASGARIISVDAASDYDLDQIAIEALALDRRILWVGSGGLASALARTFQPLPAAPMPDPVTRGPVLFCIGSAHSVTVAQQAALTTGRSAVLTDAQHATRDAIVAVLCGGNHVCLQFPLGRVSVQTARELITCIPAAALVLTGGDTASLICRAAGVQHIDLRGEIISGIPRGVLRGGELNGMPVATKSGAFGNSDAFIKIADFFSCQVEQTNSRP